MVSEDLARAVADLKVADREAVNDLRRGVRKAGEPIVRRVRSNAATFSRRIPNAVRLRAKYPARGAVVSIEVDPKIAPHAAAINNKGQAGHFRHRVFGRNVWAKQRAIPFFDRGPVEERAQVVAELDRVATTIQKRAGF